VNSERPASVWIFVRIIGKYTNKTPNDTSLLPA